MSSINFHTKQISVKIVYYGPGLCGKTTSLQTVYQSLPEERRPQIVSLATEVDRTIFFDFLPLSAYKIQDFEVRLQLYTVPGQVFYNATRKLVLNGVDGIVFVCDSQRAMKDSNFESLQNLGENLSELGLEMGKVPLVMQFNKRDLKDIFPIEEMTQMYNPKDFPAFGTIATTGQGLFDTLKCISQLVVNDLMRKGLGDQLRSRVGEVDLALQSEPDGFASVGQAVQQVQEQAPAQPAAPAPAATQPVAPVAPPVASPVVPPAAPTLPLWPEGLTGELGQTIVVALSENRWPDVVVHVDELIRHAAGQWASSQGLNQEDFLQAYLFMAGTSSARYRAFLSAVEAVRQQRPVGRGEALNAVVLALDALW